MSTSTWEYHGLTFARAQNLKSSKTTCEESHDFLQAGGVALDSEKDFRWGCFALASAMARSFCPSDIFSYRLCNRPCVYLPFLAVR